MTEPVSPEHYEPDPPNIARVYDYLLGGKDNFAVDRALAQELLSQQPDIRRNARENRAFMQRAVRMMAEAGISQFLDLGTGLPTGYNVHEVARSVIPDAQVVYVDNDEVVAAHARALLASDEGVEFVLADMRQSGEVLAKAGTLLDLTNPVAVLIISMLHFVNDDSEAQSVVSAYASALAAGSYLSLSHWQYRPVEDEELTKHYASSVHSLARRGKSEVAALLPAEWDLVEPGLVSVSAWRPPAVDISGSATDVAFLGVVLRKP
jgi:hypothetical protein